MPANRELTPSHQPEVLPISFESYKDAVDGRNMADMITYYANLGPGQRTRFFSGDFKPYEGELAGKDRTEVISVFPPLAQNLVERGETSQVAQLVHHISRFKLNPDVVRINNAYAGLDHEAQVAGELKPSQRFEETILESAYEVLGEGDEDAAHRLATDTKVKTSIPTFNMFLAFLTNASGDPGIRKVMELTIEKQAHDIGIAGEKIKLLAQAVKLRKDYGLALDTFIQGMGGPPSSVLESMITGAFEHPQFREEFARRLTIVSPDLAQKYTKKGAITYQEILAARAQKAGLPLELASAPDSESAMQLINQQIKDSLLIEADVDSAPSSVILIPEDSKRFGNYEYKNDKGHNVEVILSDAKRESDAVDQTAHEQGHGIHKRIIDALDGCDGSQSWEKVSRNQKETVAQMMGDAVSAVITHPHSSEHMIQRRDDIDEFMRFVRAGLTGLSQIYIQRKLEELYDQGVDLDTLGRPEAEAIASDIEGRLNTIVQETFGMDSLFLHGVASSVTPEFMLDGMVYAPSLLGVIPGAEKESLRTAINRKFGANWWELRDGQISFAFVCYLTSIDASDSDIIGALEQTPIEAMEETLKTHGITVKPTPEIV